MTSSLTLDVLLFLGTGASSPFCSVQRMTSPVNLLVISTLVVKSCLLCMLMQC